MNRSAAPPPPPPNNSRKRKRTPFSSSAAASATGSATAGAPVINPLSHTPGTVKQFKVAGLSIDAPLPSKIYPGFPHRSIPPPKLKPPSSSRGKKWEQFYSSEVDLDTDTDGGAEGYESGTSQVEGENTGNENSTQPGAGHVSNEEEEEHIPGRRRSRRKSTTKQDLRTPKKSVFRREAGLAAAERAQAHKKHVGGLLQIIERGLMEGNIATAKRAFGLLVRSKVYGTPVDLRYADYWKLGLDILLREGEEEEERRRKRRRRRLKKRGSQLGGNTGQQEEEGEETEDEIGGFDEEEDGFGDDEDEEEVEYKFARKRAADVLTKVKAYYETLIKLFPYNRIRPAALSSLLLYPAMFQFELDDVRTEYDQGVHRLERIRRLGGFGDEEDDDGYGYGYGYGERGELDGQQYGDDGMMDVDDPEADHHHHSPLRMGRRNPASRPRGIIDRPADKLRQKALARVTDIAHRMDPILQNLPFKTDYTLLSLRAETALLMADLSVPCLLEKEATTTTTTTTQTTTSSHDNERLSSPSQQLQQEQDRQRRSSSPEPEEHDDHPQIKYEFEQEERAQVQEGKILRHEARMKALRILTSMKKTLVVKKKGGLLDKEDEAVLAMLRKELLHGGKKGDRVHTEEEEEESNNYSSDESENGTGSGRGSDKEGGSQDGDDEAGAGELLAQGQSHKEKKRQKAKNKVEKKARRVAAEAGGFSNMSASATAGRGMFSSLPIR